MKRRPTAIVVGTTIDLAARNGPAMHLTSLMNGLARNEHRVTIVLPKSPTDPTLPLSQDIELDPCFNFRSLRLPATLSALSVGRRMIPRTTPSVAYVRASPLTALIHQTAQLSRFAGVIVEYNGWFSEEAEQLGFSKLACGLIERLQLAEARRASCIRTVTEGLKTILVDNGVEAERIAVIGNGTDVSVFHPRNKAQAAARFNLTDAYPVIGFLGNLWPVVDFDTLIQALMQLRVDYPLATLIVVGDGPSRALLEAGRAELGDNTIRLFGSRRPDEANAILATADVLVAPFRKSRNARIGLSPLKIRDYAAMGRPAAATSLPGIDDLAGVSWAALAEPESPDALAAAIRTLLNRDSATMSADARAYALKNFSWQLIADRVGGLVDEVASAV